MLVGLILALMAIAPLFWMLSMSFKSADEVFEPNLDPAASDARQFPLCVHRRSISSATSGTRSSSRPTVTIVALFFHSMAGYALARLRFPGRDAIFLAMFATFLISQPVIIVPLFILVRALGMLDSYAGLIIPSIFNAFGIFLLRQFYLAVPRELEEAALIDGAGYFRIYWSIILPLSRPILSALAILFFLANWNSFLWPLTITTDQNLWMVQVGDRELPPAIQRLLELHHGGLDGRRAADARDVRRVPEADHRIDQDQRHQIGRDRQQG